MTRSTLELAKEPFLSDQNFQEHSVVMPRITATEFALRQLDFPVAEAGLADAGASLHSSMVLDTVVRQGANREAESTTPPALGRDFDPFANWQNKTKIGRRRVSRQLTLREVRDLESAWHHARSIENPMNRFVTFRPANINELDPQQRIEAWTMWRNKLAQHARDNDFDFTCLWTRESARHTGLNEHMHVLLHVPRQHAQKFDQIVRGWGVDPGEIDVRSCSYGSRMNEKGGQKNVLTYVAKNSPQAARFLNRTIQLGGPIFGKRYGMSRNLTANARARDNVRGVLRRDLGLVTINRGSMQLPTPANDGLKLGDRSRAA